MRAVSTRYGKRRLHVAGILALAGVFLYHGMCSLNDSASSGERLPEGAAIAGADASLSCEWEEGGPELFVIRHNENHPDASHWFHVAECFTGRRADLKKTIRDKSGTVYLQILDPSWMAKLSPMSRLLVASALTGAGTSNVHFVDADRASFSYSSSSGTTTTKTPEKEADPPSVHIDGNALAPARNGGDGAGANQGGSVAHTEGAGGTRGRPHRRQQQQQPQQQKKKVAKTTTTAAAAAAAAAPNGQPRSGQVGLLEFDPRDRGSEFVVSMESSVSDRLTVTAGIHKSTDNQDGEGPRGNRPHGGGSVRGGGGGRGDTSYGGQGDSAREPVCVKYLETVGQKAVQRRDWFPSPEDARSFQEAIDTYCPVPFLWEESEDQGDGEAGEGGKRQRRRGGEEGGEGGAGRVRRLLLYQRDRNRQIRNAKMVAEDLQQRLGDRWVVEEMVHDSDRHPCELVETLGGVDVLLTAHGFQSMLGLFMRPGSLMFEVFPHKYFKAGYAPMAEGLGVRHAFSMSRPLRPLTGFSHPTTETCMNWYLCRWYSRGSDVEVDDESLKRLVELALEPAA